VRYLETNRTKILTFSSVPDSRGSARSNRRRTGNDNVFTKESNFFLKNNFMEVDANDIVPMTYFTQPGKW